MFAEKKTKTLLVIMLALALIYFTTGGVQFTVRVEDLAFVVLILAVVFFVFRKKLFGDGET